MRSGSINTSASRASSQQSQSVQSVTRAVSQASQHLRRSISRGPSLGGSSGQAPSPTSESKSHMLRQLDAKTQAVQGAYEQTMALLKASPSLSIKESAPRHMGLDLAAALLSAAEALHEEAASATAQGREAPSGAGTALAVLQAHIEEQQRQQSALLANLSEQWERRFANLEQALNSGLEAATSATAQMNERSAKFVSLAEVLEGAVGKALRSSKEVGALSQELRKVEDDLACLAQELANDKGERSRMAAAISRKAEVQIASLCETLREDLRTAAARPSPREQTGPVASTGDLERIVRELGEERGERRQLALQLQDQASDTAQLQVHLDSVNEHLLRMSRELTALSSGNSRAEAETSRGSEASRGDTGRNDYVQRLETLGKDLRSELANRSSSSSGGLSKVRPSSNRSPTRFVHGSLSGQPIERIEEEEEHQCATQALSPRDSLGGGSVDGDTGSDTGKQRSPGMLRGWSSGTSSPKTVSPGGLEPGSSLFGSSEGLVKAMERLVGRPSMK